MGVRADIPAEKRVTGLTVFLAAALMCAPGASAQQRNVDTQASTLTIRVGKTGIFSALAHEHEVRAPIQDGIADVGSHPSVEIHVDARTLRVIDKDASEKDRAGVQATMLGPEVLDSERYPEIVFKSTSADSDGEGRWTLRGGLTLRGQARPVIVHVTLKDGRYTGDAIVKQTDFGIKPPGPRGVKAKNEVGVEFDVRLGP